jgi:methionyl-tRNA synthetase
MSRFVVTITPPTPNGDVHIGHLSGPFLGADIFARAQRQRGHDCVLVSYSDDYQSYMLRRGLELGVDHKQLALRNTAKINASLEAVDIDVDIWMLAQDNPFFRAAVTETFEAAKAAGALVWKVTNEPYCPNCDRWGYEAFGRGLCNFCGHDSDASQCEECAQAPDASNMANFVCKLCGQPHDWRPVGRWFLRLGEFKDILRRLHSANPMRPPLGDWAKQAIDTLVDWGVTRPEDGGLDLEPDGSCRVHTWFMGLSGYIAAVREWADRTGKPEVADAYFKDPEARFVHFLGYDCAFSHALVYPALLSTMTDYAIGQDFVPNMFLKLDGLNLSTSRGHAIWVSEFAQRAPSDSIRLYLAHVAPEQEGGDFWSSAFETWLDDTFGKTIPAILAAGPGTRAMRDMPVQTAVADCLERLAGRLEHASAPKTFSMKAMADVVLDTLALAREQLADPAALRTVALFLAGAGAPLVPRLVDDLARAFGFDAVALRDAIRPSCPVRAGAVEIRYETL